MLNDVEYENHFSFQRLCQLTVRGCRLICHLIIQVINNYECMCMATTSLVKLLSLESF